MVDYFDRLKFMSWFYSYSIQSLFVVCDLSTYLSDGKFTEQKYLQSKINGPRPPFLSWGVCQEANTGAGAMAFMGVWVIFFYYVLG